MMGSLSFLVGIMPSGSWQDVLGRCKQAETLGFDMITTGDHFCDWNDPVRPWFEAWTMLAAVARETSRIRLATYVSQVPLRNPAFLARQALTLDHLSEGRIEVGLGTGLRIDPAYEIMGIENWTDGERVARLEEYVQIVDRLLSNETSSFDGTFYQIKDAVMNPRPVQSPRPPIVIAALAPKMLKLAATYADKWNTLSFAQSFDAQLGELKERVARIEDDCATLGRDPASLTRSFYMFDPESRASGGSIAYYQSENLFVDQVSQLLEQGVTEFGLYYPTLAEQLPAFERIAQDIIPSLKRSF